MEYLRKLGIGIVIALALLGGYQGFFGAWNLYDDWVFLRRARITALRQQLEAAKAKPAPPAAEVK